MARLKDAYNETVKGRLIEKFGYSSAMQAPKLVKITLNMGVGEAKQDRKMLEAAKEQLAQIAGQQPNIRRARKSVAAFKLREGMPVGLSVTLRDERAYEFLDRLTAIAIPRIRDFRGLNPRSFDGRGNYSMGVREQIIFPEIDYDNDRPGARPGRDHHDDRADRRRGLRAAGRAGHAVLPRGTSGRLRVLERPGRRGLRNRERTHPWQRHPRSSPAARPPKFKTRAYTRCRKCGRPRAVYRKFGLCRICLREMAHEGFIPGMTKSSW